MTLQEAFDKNWQHFVVEGKGASVKKNEHGAFDCMYRGDDGCRCGIGVILSDDDYNPGMEKLPVQSLVAAYKPASLAGLDVNNLSELQACHDLAYANSEYSPAMIRKQEFSTGIARRLRAFAAEYKLKVPEVAA